MESGNFPLQFTIEILSAHFSSPGQYFLVLRIVGSKVKPSTIKLYVGNSQNALDRHEFTTDACLEDGDPETFATFNDSLISFWMPAGRYSIINYYSLRCKLIMMLVLVSLSPIYRHY